MEPREQLIKWMEQGHTFSTIEQEADAIIATVRPAIEAEAREGYIALRYPTVKDAIKAEINEAIKQGRKDVAAYVTTRIIPKAVYPFSEPVMISKKQWQDKLKEWGIEA